MAYLEIFIHSQNTHCFSSISQIDWYLLSEHNISLGILLISACSSTNIWTTNCFLLFPLCPDRKRPASLTARAQNIFCLQQKLYRVSPYVLAQERNTNKRQIHRFQQFRHKKRRLETLGGNGKNNVRGPQLAFSILFVTRYHNKIR